MTENSEKRRHTRKEIAKESAMLILHTAAALMTADMYRRTLEQCREEIERQLLKMYDEKLTQSSDTDTLNVTVKISEKDRRDYIFKYMKKTVILGMLLYIPLRVLDKLT